MPRITPGNRLYLYSLFSREIGVGKQTMLSRVEEVLLADDIMPCDLAGVLNINPLCCDCVARIACAFFGGQNPDDIYPHRQKMNQKE